MLDGPQTKHAQEIAAERAVMVNYGVSRSQARQALHEFARNVQDRAAAEATARAVESSPPEDFLKPATSETALPASGISGGSQQSSTPPALPTFTGIVNNDGVATYASVFGSLGGVVGE